MKAPPYSDVMYPDVDLSEGEGFDDLSGYLVDIAGMNHSNIPGMERFTLSQYNWVYVLECHKSTKEKIELKHKAFFEGSVPNWVDEALKHERLLYIGSTNNIVERIREHIHQFSRRTEDTGRTMFTTYFPPKMVIRLLKYDSLDRARKMEEVWSKVYENSDLDTFVFQA